MQRALTLLHGYCTLDSSPGSSGNDTSLDAALQDIVGANPAMREEWERIVQLQLVPALKVLKHRQPQAAAQEVPFESNRLRQQDAMLAGMASTLSGLAAGVGAGAGEEHVSLYTKAVGELQEQEDTNPLAPTDEVSRLRSEVILSILLCDFARSSSRKREKFGNVTL
jgi:hypothetical protein